MSKVSDALQQVLVDLTDLSLVAKQLHWNIKGPGFKALHLELDDVVDGARNSLDDVAERLVTIGSPADGRVATVAKSTSLKEAPTGPVSTEDARDYIVDAMKTVADKVKGYIDEVDDEDPVSGDLLIGIAGGIDKARWMLEAGK